MTVEDKLAPAKESSEVALLAGKRHSTESSSLRQAKIPTLPRWTNIHFCSSRDRLDTLRQTRKSSTIDRLGFNQITPPAQVKGHGRGTNRSALSATPFTAVWEAMHCSPMSSPEWVQSEYQDKAQICPKKSLATATESNVLALQLVVECT